MNQARIAEGLRALAEGEKRGPSMSVESSLLRELQQADRKKRWKAAVFPGALAAGLACVMFLPRPHTEQTVVKQQPPIHIADPVIVVPASTPRPTRRRTRAHPQTAALEFVEVPFATPLEPYERAQLLRVSMPATALASWGFPLGAGDPERVINADVVVGENGLARAVRLIR